MNYIPILFCALIVFSPFGALAATVNASFTSENSVPITDAGYAATGNDIAISLGFAPPTGINLTVVKNTGLPFISGQFSNLAHGQAVDLTYGGKSYRFVANYYGGTGNDLVLHWAHQQLSTWGSNSYGNLGNGSVIESSTPVLVTQSGVLADKTVVSVTAGIGHSLALCSDGTLAGWGESTSGELGNNTLGGSGVPVLVTQIGALAGKTVISVTAGGRHSLALCSDGTLVSWGANNLGQLGNSTIGGGLPVLVTQSGVLSGKAVVSVAAGYEHSLALCSDGTLAAWGNNTAGQLGNNSTSHSSVPVLVTQSGVLSGKTVVSVAAGDSHSLALCSDGTLAAWGYNYYGQLGNNSTTSSSVPVLVTRSGVLSGKTVVSVAAGLYHNLVLCSDGKLAAWGRNSSGQLGNNSTTNSSVPVLVIQSGVLAGKTVMAVTAGKEHSLALCSNGALATWGLNNSGQLGNSGTSNSSVPVLVTQSGVLAGKSVVSMAAGQSHSLVLASVQNLPDLSGLSLSSGLLNPVFVSSTTNYNAPVTTSSAITIKPTVADTTATVKVNGTSVTSGTSSAPLPLELGTNTITILVTAWDKITTATSTISVTRVTLEANFTSPSTIPDTAEFYAAMGGSVAINLGFAPPTGTNLTVVKNTGIASISGQFSNLAQGQMIDLSYGGKSYRFVANYYGGTGNDLVLQWAYQNLTAWGAGSLLGNNSTTSSSVPALVTQSGVLSGKTVVSLAAGGHYHSLALCSDGAVAAWGDNSYGQLGNGTTLDSNVPVLVTQSGVLAGKTVVSVAAGFRHSIALCTDGTLAAWGVNWNGLLGNNSTTNSSVPVLVTQSGVLAGKTVVAIAAGQHHSLVLCSDGTLATWGSGNLVPVLVTQSGVLSGKTVVSLSAGSTHSLVLCSDGTLATWGSNGSGQLGNNSTTSSSVPVLVTRNGALSGKTVVSVASGFEHSLALCSDGTLAAWGWNTSGQLGNNSTTNSSVPVLVMQSGGLAGKTIVSVAAGSNHSLALCSDGTLAAWGNNGYGQLGNGSTSTSGVPVRVTQSGVLAGKVVGSVAAGEGFSVAMASVSNSPDLSGLSSSVGNFSPLFEPDINSYSTSVLFAISSITVSPTSASNGAVIRVNGTIVSSGVPSQTIPLAVGPNLVTIVVTAPDGETTKTYSINVTRQPVSSAATLSSLAPSSGILYPAFALTTTNYSSSVTNATTSITVRPTVTDATATVKVNGTTVPPGSNSAAIPLTVGVNTITILVTAQDDVTTSTYTLTVSRAPSSVSTLSGSTLSAGTLSPTFTSGTTSYTASVANSTTSITVSPTVTDTTASIKVNGNTVTSGSASTPIPLNVGTNALTILVTAQDGTTTGTYTVTVTRAPSSVSSLAGLMLSDGDLSPTFAADTTSYTTSVPNAVSSLIVTSTVTDATSTVDVNGVAVNSGESSAPISLAVGSNTITVLVTAQDGTTTRTYTVTVARASSSVETLSGLALTTGTLSPAFSSATTNYTSSVSNATSSLKVTPTATVSTATIKINGAAVLSGSASSSIPLSVGTNTIAIQVTAQDGITVKTYTVKVTRLASSVNTLSGLALKSATLSPKFNKTKSIYTASVANSVSSLKVKPTATSNLATIKVNGFKVKSGVLSKAIALKRGKNTIKVVVTAQDGTTKTYKITVTRGGVAKSIAMSAATNSPIQKRAIPEIAEITKTTVEGQLYLQLTLIKGNENTMHVVEVSSNLVDWYSGNHHTTTLIDDDSMLRVRDNTPIKPGKMRYLRHRQIP